MIVYKTGSGVNPYINNPHDTDYIVFLSDTEFDSFNQRKYNDGHLMKRQLSTYGDVVKVWSYLWGYMQLVEGKAVQLPNFFDKKDKWLAVAKSYLYCNGKRKSPLDQNGKQRKSFYHLLMGLYILDNNSFELTTEQANNVQLAHDGNLPQEIIEWLYSKITL